MLALDFERRCLVGFRGTAQMPGIFMHCLLQGLCPYTFFYCSIFLRLVQADLDFWILVSPRWRQTKGYRSFYSSCLERTESAGSFEADN